MRITKRVQEYIERQVREKIYAKYEDERLEAERQEKILREFWENMTNELEERAKVAIDSFLENYGDFLERRSGNSEIIHYYSSSVLIKDRYSINSVHKWRERANEEIYKKVDDIIVTLELGGNKADLDRMLSEI